MMVVALRWWISMVVIELVRLWLLSGEFVQLREADAVQHGLTAPPEIQLFRCPLCAYGTFRWSSREGCRLCGFCPKHTDQRATRNWPDGN